MNRIALALALLCSTATAATADNLDRTIQLEHLDDLVVDATSGGSGLAIRTELPEGASIELVAIADPAPAQPAAPGSGLINPFAEDAGPTAAAPATAAEVASPAPVEMPDASDPLAFGSAIWAMARAGLWLLLATSILYALVALARRKEGWIRKQWSWLGTDRGGAVLVLALAALGDAALQMFTTAQAPPGAAGGFVAVLTAGARALLKGLFTPKVAST